MAPPLPFNLWTLLGLGVAGILIMTKKRTRVIKADFGAFVERFELLPPTELDPANDPHSLTPLSFAVSDIFDILGYVTGFGNPDWARSQAAASTTSNVVSLLVERGATCIGKTVLDDMAFSSSGENRYYDTPTNPANPGRIPGGPSSGAAVAVAANIVEFSLGIDTVGGVRIPAAYCGVLGFRPSFGAISHVGIIPVATSLDTVGWFARDPSILRRVGHVLLEVQNVARRHPKNIIIADDCFQLSKIPVDRVTQAVINSTEKLYGRQALRHENLGGYVVSKVGSLKVPRSKQSSSAGKSSPLRMLAYIMQQLHRQGFRDNHGNWVDSANPTLSPFINEPLEITDGEITRVLTGFRSALTSLLKDDGILVVPTVANPPPKLDSKEISSEDYLTRTSTLMSLASLSGFCQVTIPLGFHDKCPLSVSFIAMQGQDSFLLETVHTMYATLQQQADVAGKSKVSEDAVSQESRSEIAYEQGNKAFTEQQWKRAIDFYGKAINLNSHNARYYINRAEAYIVTRTYTKAETDCNKAISLDGMNADAYLKRGVARERLGYPLEALQDYQHVLVLQPTNNTAAQSADRVTDLITRGI